MMDDLTRDEQQVDVGGRLRELRQERGKSMRALARLSGLSTNALSMIERGRTSPSVNTLHKISEALEVPITAFFRLEPPRHQIVFRKSGEREHISLEKGGWEGLGGESFVGRLEPFVLNLEPGAASGEYGTIHSGHEFVLCLEGRVEYVVDDQMFSLEPGDSLIFASRLKHRWENRDDDTASVLVVLSGFELDERPSEYHILSSQLEQGNGKSSGNGNGSKG
jgi:transcriptional regulator with XRE-family HTH domain